MTALMTVTHGVAELHERLVAEIRGNTNRDHRKLANNTYGRIDDTVGGRNTVYIRLHDTDIAIIDPHAASYHTGGWFTVTTKERINRYLPGGWSLGSEKRVWWLSQSVRNGDWEDDFGGPKYVWERRSRFYDGIILRDTPEGVQVQVPMLDDPDAHLRKRINDYVALYTDAEIKWLTDRVRESGNANGDCLYCQFRPVDGSDFSDHSHLDAHMRARYTMFSVMWNALTEKGYREPGAVLSYGMTDSVRRAIRDYFNKRLLNRR